MDYWQHSKFNFILALIFSGYALFKHLNNFSFVEFWQGVIPWTLLITCDLDSKESIVTRIWRAVGLGWIWKPFYEYGHREVLHHPAWGSFILVAPFWMVLQAVDIDLSEWVIIGAVFAVEGHIVADWIDSRWKRIWKKINKVMQKLNGFRAKKSHMRG